jgi:type I restriction enzyme S subunit
MLLRLKTPVEIQDTEFYKRLTIRINHQGVTVRDTEIGSNIGTKNQFRVCAGDFILSKIDARQGAFGIVPPEADGGIITGNFWTYRVDNQFVDTEWFLQFTNSDAFLDLCKRSSTGNTHRKYLNENIFLNHELVIPSLEEQRRAVVACKTGNKSVEEVRHEIAHQQSLLAKLKQAILQEAIQGKLTADWRAAYPDVEPASQLLHRIQAEKARLIAAKKLRPEKPLPKITPAAIPFEIPKGWEWCRFGQAIRLMNGNSFESGDFKKGTGVKCIKITNAGVGEFVETDDTLPLGFDKAYAKYQVFSGDLILALTRPYIATGLKISRCPESYDGALLNQRVAAIRPIDGILDSDFAFLFLGSDFVLRGYQAEFESKGQQPNLKSEHVTHLRLPLPPLAEQAAIVERVEALMTTCRALEAEIEHARTHAAHLLQAVLKEAFAPAS